MDLTLSATQQAYNDRLVRHLASQPEPDAAVLAAVAALPRHWFVDQLDGQAVDPGTERPELLERLYSDHALCIQQRAGVGTSSTSQPSLMAQMMVDAGVGPGHRVLEIGTGSGWNAALLSRLVGPDGLVVSLEVDADLAAAARAHLERAGVAGVAIRCADGLAGAADLAPFDVVMVTVGCPDIAPAWLDQLTDGGRLLAPYALPDGSAPLLRLTRQGERCAGRWLRWTWFVGLRGGGMPEWPVAQEPGTDLERRRLPAGPWPHLSGDHRPTAHFDLWLAARLPSIAVFRFQSWDRCGLLEGDSLAFCAEPDLYWRGASATADRLEQLCREWLRAGAPRLTDYAVSTCDPGPRAHRICWRRPTTPLWLSWG